jgi:D-glycero-D-manno-heptose 1,7-bisphosphate phosphatase
MDKAIFLDRDGTINVDKAYLYKISDFEFMPGAREALLLLQEAGYRLVVITNQSGIARGYYREEDLSVLHNWLLRTLDREGIHISGIYYCPHHPQGKIDRYRMECDCRKPRLGLFFRASLELNIDLSLSVAIGDRMRDLQICKTHGCRGYLLGGEDREASLPVNIKRAVDLLAAAGDIIMSNNDRDRSPQASGQNA